MYYIPNVQYLPICTVFGIPVFVRIQRYTSHHNSSLFQPMTLPSLHSQWKLPGRLIHFALLPHSLALHSSISAKVCVNKLKYIPYIIIKVCSWSLA